MVGGPQGPRRIRLVAYGARLESVLGASPQGFESPILRSVMSAISGAICPGGVSWFRSSRDRDRVLSTSAGPPPPTARAYRPTSAPFRAWRHILGPPLAPVLRPFHGPCQEIGRMLVTPESEDHGGVNVDAIAPIDGEPAIGCSCCGRTLPRRKVHALSGGAGFVCRRCGLWIAVRLRNDRPG